MSAGTGNTIPVVWTNDDIGCGTAAHLRRQLEFLDRHGIPGVFFVVPKSGARTIDEDNELLELIESSKQRGHEYYQHGYEHHAFECGVPDMNMFALAPAVLRQFDCERGKIEAMHTFEALVEMLANGQRIWRKALGEDSAGFRPGYGSFCNNLYRALAVLGFEWVSSRIPCMTSWLWNAGKWEEPVDFREGFPIAPHRLPQGITEFPIAGDYAFRVPNEPEKIDAMVELALREFEVFAGEGQPMLICSHFHGLEFAGSKEPGTPPIETGTGYQVHEKLIPALLATGRAHFSGMRQLAGARVRPGDPPPSCCSP